MSANSGGSFAALLMSGPLAAIPLMALFGVPQFGSETTSTDDEATGILRRPQSLLTKPAQTNDESSLVAISEPQILDQALPAESKLQPTSRLTVWDGVSETTSSPHPSGTYSTESVVPVSSSEGLHEPSSQNAVAHEATPPRMRPTPTTMRTTPALASESTSWENAAHQLQELGIDDYRLERGLTENTYLFICQFAPGADKRIIRRFEAEATEPAVAVQKVLQRIMDWQLQASTH